MKNKQKGFVEVLILVYFAVLLLGVVGWVKDVVKLVHTDFKSPYKAEVIYGVGAVSPLGAITGWINIKD